MQVCYIIVSNWFPLCWTAALSLTREHCPRQSKLCLVKKNSEEAPKKPPFPVFFNSVFLLLLKLLIIRPFSEFLPPARYYICSELFWFLFAIFDPLTSRNRSANKGLNFEFSLLLSLTQSTPSKNVASAQITLISKIIFPVYFCV